MLTTPWPDLSRPSGSFMDASRPLQDVGGRIKSGHGVLAHARICSHPPRLSGPAARFAGRPHRASGALGAAGGAGWAGAAGIAGAGTAGALGLTGTVSGDPPPSSMIERGARVVLPSTTRRMLVPKNKAARIAVVRVNRLAVERPVMNPDIPPPPIPSAPPSLFCSITT